MHIEEFYQQFLGMKQEEKQAPTQQENILTVQQINMKHEILQKLNSPAYLMFEARKTNQSVDEIITNLNQQFDKYSHLQLVDIVQHSPVLEDRDSDYEDVEEQQEEQESYEDDQDSYEDENQLSYQDDSQLHDQIIQNIELEQEPQQQGENQDYDSDEINDFATYIEND